MDVVTDLVQALDRRDGDGDEAAESLVKLGPEALSALTGALAGLSTFGKLGAIDVMVRWEDRAACEALTDLLDDDNETVREWAAGAVGAIGCIGAVPALEGLRQRQLRDGVPPRFTGPVAVRHALTQLGARDPVLPAEVQELSVQARNLGTVWPLNVVATAIEVLARHDQAVLYVMFWRQEPSGELYWQDHERSGWSLDSDRPWEENVTAGREAALLEIECAPDTDELLASLEWIDRSDLELR